MTTIELIEPDWPAPAQVGACSTTRKGGVSEGAWQGLNLATHVNDEPQRVQRNRELLGQSAGLPCEAYWLSQVHGVEVCSLPRKARECRADAAFTDQPGQVCTVLTADCLPVLFCDRQGSRVAAAHAGWRGLAAGVLEATLGRFDNPGEVLAWMGPAIGPQAFEVGDEVRAAFITQLPESDFAFVRNGPGHWMADIYALARMRLRASGVNRVYGGGWCTYSDAQRFYSYRRKQITGRMASLIWLRA